MGVRIGDRGVTVGRLNPAGEVDVGGTRRPARAAFGALDPGTAVTVVGSNEFGLLVRQCGDDGPPNPGGTTDEVLTPTEKVDERADEVLEFADHVRDEVRNTFLVFLALPILCGAAFAAAGYWAADMTGLIVGLILGLVVGSAFLLKLFLANS
jgi:hypothetical protein